MQDASLVLAQNPDKISQSWRNVLLGDVIKLTKKSKEVRYADYKDIPFIPMEVIPIGRMFFEQFDLRSNTEISSGTYFEPGDILLAKITPSFENGKQGIIQKLPIGFGIATTEVIPINEIDGISDKYFLFYYLLQNGVRTELANKMDGSTGRQRLSVIALMSLKIALPSLHEQRTIAHILQTTQNAIQARREELELERERKAALMQHLFTHGTRGEATKPTEIGEMPKSWALEQLGNVCLSSAFGPRFGGEYYSSNGNIATLRTTDIDDEGHINYATMPLAQLDLSQFESHLLHEKDLVITRSGTCGIAAVFETFERLVLPGAFLIRFRLTDKVNPYFLCYYINSYAGRIRVLQLASGAIQKNLTGTSLRSFTFPFPSLVEQHTIINILQICDSKIAALEKEIALQEELFHALLEELMSGRLSALPLVE